MTQTEIQQAASVWVEGLPKSWHEFIGRAFKAGAKMVNSKQPYTAEDIANLKRFANVRWTDTDLQEFAEWCSINASEYYPLQKYWIQHYLGEEKTTSDLQIEWEIETGRKQPEKLTKTEYLKQVEEAKKNIPPEATSYDLQKHGSFTGRRVK
jgi:hypothetical protein